MNSKKIALFFAAAIILTGCQNETVRNTNVVSNANTNLSNSSAPTSQTLTEAQRPQKIVDMAKERGTQEEAKPVLKVAEPADGSTINSSTVKVKLELSGDLKGYKPMMNEETKMGNHIHVILDNQPYEAYYNLEGGAFELRNVADGEHTLRVFPSRPWHESYKNDEAFQIVKFVVKNGGADASKPTTTNSGQPMSNANMNANAMTNQPAANSNANAAPAKTPEGKDMQKSAAGTVDRGKPLLTYSRPKGEYKGADAEAIMIDFWLSNGKLTGDGGEYRVRWSVDGSEPKFIETWKPLWLSGWTNGKHSIKLELVDKNGNVVDNGGYNSTEREITIAK